MNKPMTFHSFKHGLFDVTVLSDGPIVLDGEIFAPQATDGEREEIVVRLAGADNVAEAQSNIPLIIAANDVILVDVGAGSLFQPGEGQLEGNLNSVGVKAGDVTKIILSHAHPDHIWGMIREDGTLRFSNARYYITRSEWEFWMGEEASALPEAIQPFVTGARRDLQAIADRVTFVEDGDEIIPGLRVLSTPGHTAGHISLVLDGLSTNAALANKTGNTSATTPAGNPYINVQTGDLLAGASVSVNLDLSNSNSSLGILYTTRVLAGPGSR